MNVESQNQSIRKHLLSGKTITPLTALHKFGTLRLAARIYDCHSLMPKGKRIEKQMVKVNGARVAKYFVKGVK